MTFNHIDPNGRPKTRPGWRIYRFGGLVLGGIFLAALFALVLGIVVQWLWNWLMPELFGLKVITFWQAVGLLFLAKLLFGGFRRHFAHPSGRRFAYNHDDHWRNYRRYWHEKGEEAAEDLIDRAYSEKGNERDKTPA